MQTRGWQTGLFSLYGRLVVKKYKTFLATYKPVGGVIRVVLVREPDRWVAYFSTDPDLSVASILETVADRSALEQVFHDVKEVHGAGQQQLRHVWANVGAWNLIGWWHTLVELWAWDRPQSRLRDPERLAVGQARASSVACQSLSGVTSRGVTGRIFVATVRGALRQKSAGSFSAMAESHEADSSGKVQWFRMLVEIHVRDAARDPTLANAECGIEFLFIPNSEFRSRRTGLARYGRSQTSACRLLDRAPSRWHLARSGFATVVEYERIPRAVSSGRA